MPKTKGTTPKDTTDILRAQKAEEAEVATAVNEATLKEIKAKAKQG